MTSSLELLFIEIWIVFVFITWLVVTVHFISVLRNAIHPPQPYPNKKVELKLLYNNNNNNTDSEIMPAITHTRPVLETMRTGFLKIILSENNLPTSGKKADLVERILDHQSRIQANDEDLEQLMIKGSAIQDDEFEKVINPTQRGASRTISTRLKWTQVAIPFQRFISTKFAPSS